MFYSHNQIIGLLTRIAEEHEQIKSFGFGELFDQAHSNLLYNADDNNLQAPTYPLMWGALVDSVLSNTDAVAAPQLVTNYQIVVSDMMYTDESNKDEILSDCQLICLDIIGILQSSDYYSYFFVDKVANLTPFVGMNENDDSAIGWTFNIGFRVSYNNRCNIPSPIPSPLPIS